MKNYECGIAVIVHLIISIQYFARTLLLGIIAIELNLRRLFQLFPRFRRKKNAESISNLATVKFRQYLAARAILSETRSTVSASSRPN